MKLVIHAGNYFSSAEYRLENNHFSVLFFTTQQRKFSSISKMFLE